MLLKTRNSEGKYFVTRSSSMSHSKTNATGEYAGRHIQVETLRCSMDSIYFEDNNSQMEAQPDGGGLVVGTGTSPADWSSWQGSGNRNAASKDHSRPPPEIVYLNVGGVHLATSPDTLRTDRSSMLAVMQRWEWRIPSKEKCEIFIDRDGERFKHVLNYLRNGTVHLGQEPQDRVRYFELLEEAEYFNLDGMKQLLIEGLKKIDEESVKPRYDLGLRHDLVDVLGKLTSRERSLFQELLTLLGLLVTDPPLSHKSHVNDFEFRLDDDF
ncbi:hypothetical protein CBR_g23172 [Chara braunii]|uniref:BTB domain-containing protein n=1 Tax=Chara braunii TaxID=69332 RepID=A0A388JV62_CHABU|nr:hypothetical protein CBR_g23172 [Chara braunii]|eukprot:GBG61657.1 hypothetical protein CBR_g23172 [Chara braunii]